MVYLVVSSQAHSGRKPIPHRETCMRFGVFSFLFADSNSIAHLTTVHFTEPTCSAASSEAEALPNLLLGASQQASHQRRFEWRAMVHQPVWILKLFVMGRNVGESRSAATGFQNLVLMRQGMKKSDAMMCDL